MKNKKRLKPTWTAQEDMFVFDLRNTTPPIPWKQLRPLFWKESGTHTYNLTKTRYSPKASSAREYTAKENQHLLDFVADEHGATVNRKEFMRRRDNTPFPIRARSHYYVLLELGRAPPRVSRAHNRRDGGQIREGILC